MSGNKPFVILMKMFYLYNIKIHGQICTCTFNVYIMRHMCHHWSIVAFQFIGKLTFYSTACSG